MSKYIVLYNFNKYYNRKIKRLATFADYEALITPGENTPAHYKGFKREFRNFDFSDGVYAKHVINIAKDELLSFKVDQPDYFVLEESYTEGEGEEATTTTKVSRWFVLEAVRTRGNQYELSLRRDLLADYYNEVLTAPVFIERGSPVTYNDPAIFNKEGFTFNQIKKYELLLNSNKLSGKRGGWIVGYLNRADEPYEIKDAKCNQEINLDVPNFGDLPQNLQDIITNRSTVTLKNKYDLSFAIPIKWRYRFDDTIQTQWSNTFRDIRFKLDENTEIKNLELASTTSTNGAMPYFRTYSRNGYATLFNQQQIIDYVRDNLSGYGVVSAAFQDIIDNDSSRIYITQELYNSYNNTYYYKDGKYHKIIFNPQANYVLNRQYTSGQMIAQYDNLAYKSLTMIQSLISYGQTPTYPDVVQNPDLSQNQLAISLDRSMPVYAVTTEESDATEFKVTIPTTRNQLLDSPYDMFVMPLGSVTIKGRTGESDFVNNLNTSLAAARGIAATGTSSKVLDIQILPYCPFPELIDGLGDIDLSTAEAEKDYTIIEKVLGGVHVPLGVILYPLHSQGTFDYDLYGLDFLGNPHHYSQEDYSYLLETFLESDEIMPKKVLSETRLIRFVSPNFSAIYDINPQKNGYYGITHINVDYYYKPYTPYIHVKPDFDGLYGVETNDPKGLICSGDFSIATASSRWEEYQVQNKNYQNIFDRQIANLDVNNSIALQQAQITGGIGIATSALSGAAAGAIAGSVVPGIGTAIGAVVGAAGGALASGVGFAKDMDYLKKSQAEARSFATDMYTYQLGNVKALPNTLNRVSAFTPNNKIFPFIEVYDCTEEEKEALRNKIKYNGMTIMRIGHIEDYINRDVTYYVQGQLIRLEGIDEDSHVIAEIANEIKEGAYYYGSDTSES